MKIGIITMHRVINYGSALQAFALQYELEKLGHEVEIIDYIFPRKNSSLWDKFIFYIKRKAYLLRIGKLFSKTKEEYFREFSKSFIKKSKLSYNQEDLMKNPPLYDLYMVGSDQVWNPRWTKKDTSFLLSFIENGIKTSYASSFTVSHLDEEYTSVYKKFLSNFKHITVREDSGRGIVKELTGKNAECVCDPTMLLTAKEYDHLVQSSKIQIKGDYILVYILTYMYNPYPDVNSIIATISHDLSMQAIYLDGNKYTVYDKTCKTISEVGPCEFLWLFCHASFVVTSSYHGCIFASIFSKPLIAITDSDSNDDRMVSLLNKLEVPNSMIQYNCDISLNEDINTYIPNQEKLHEFSSFSKNVLQNMLLN